jgi:diguanylate cyclase (GGDEF)-like protein
VTIVMADLNGLKAANDQWGHAVGDALLRRVGEVLSKAVDKPSCAARIGGDEFAMLLPGVDAHGGAILMEEIRRLTDLNNQFYPGMILSLSMGAATSAFGERLEEVVRRADGAMYEAKRDFYSDLTDNDRRSAAIGARMASK